MLCPRGWRPAAAGRGTEISKNQIRGAKVYANRQMVATGATRPPPRRSVLGPQSSSRSVLCPHVQDSKSDIKQLERIELPVSETRVVNGRVYCLPDVRARDLVTSQPGNKILGLSDSSIGASCDEIEYQSDTENKPIRSESADVVTFYGLRKRQLPGRGSRPVVNRFVTPPPVRYPKLPKLVTIIEPPGRVRRKEQSVQPVAAHAQKELRTPVSQVDSCSGMYSSGEEEAAEQVGPYVQQSELSRFYTALTDLRPKFYPNNKPIDYAGDACESLYRIAMFNDVDVSLDGIQEMIRQRKRREADAEAEVREQEERIRNMDFEGSQPVDN